jgi:DNA-binding response OmpR family regulator
MTALHQDPDIRDTSEGIDSLTARVLVVGDEDAHRTALQFGLLRAGFAVKTVRDGASALRVVHEWNPDTIILEVMLPKVDGFALLPMIRRLSEAPIIMVSSQNTASEKVAALVRGADDYVCKPFDMEELIARVHCALRRPHLAVRETLRYGGLVVDVARRTVVRANRQIELSRREFDLLLMLMRHPTRVFTRSELLDGVWGVDSDVTSSLVDTYISYLRAKIDARHDRKLIHTVRGVGFTLRDTGK